MTRTARRALIPIAFVLGAILIAVSRSSLIDGDEGFYLLAAKSVFHGKVLYRELFYTQMPLLPYLYGAWMQIAGETWNSGRLLSALLATALGCLLYWHINRITGSLLAGCVAVLLFVSSSYVLVWYPLVKTYSLSTVLLFGAYLLLWEVSDRRALILGGLLLGLSIDTRLYVAATIPIFLMCIYCHRAKLPRPAISYALFAAGLAMGLAPNLFWLMSDPANYFFNNLGYHAVRSKAGFVGGFHQKFGMLLKISGLYPSVEANGLPFGILVLLNGLNLVLSRRFPGPRVWPAIYLAATIIVVSALPTPTFFQYYCVAVPFLVVGALTFVWDYCRSPLGAAAMAVLLLAYLAPLPGDISRYLFSGKGVISVSVPENAINWRLNSVREISRQIDKQAARGEPVLSFWPGYLLESQAIPLPGMESDVGLYVAPQLSGTELRRYSILSKSDIEADLSRRYPCVAVVGNQEAFSQDGAYYESVLTRYGYRPVYRLGHTTIYTCKP